MTAMLEARDNKRGKQRAAKAPQQAWAKDTFVQYELSKDEQASCKGWLVDAVDLLDVMEKTIDGGYKFTLKYDEYGQCGCAFMFPASPDSVNSGRVLTGRGSTVAKALKQVLFKHHVVFEGSWPSDGVGRGGDAFDD